jgi:nicotinamide mononucleotide transporter
MPISEIIQALKTNIQLTTWPEWISTVMQIASVYYAQKNKIWVFPTGIIGVILAAYVYFFVSKPPLYADASLNIYYFVMSVYGWYNWSLKKDSEAVFPISYCSKKELWQGIALFALVWVSIYFILQLTNSNTVLLDSLVSATAVTAMFWMAKRKVENWQAWIVSNLIAIPLNFYKGFILFTLMYILFLAMAIYGYYSWKKQITK